MPSSDDKNKNVSPASRPVNSTTTTTTNNNNNNTSSYIQPYKSIEELWAERATGDLYDREKGWYGKSLQYWSEIPADLNGTLGGMTFVNDVDIKESREFIESLPNRGTKRALDCAAGIGRITKQLIVKLYETTDVLEALPHMLDQAKKELTDLPVGDFFLTSMEKAELKPKYYDLIVIQWAAIYLTDSDFVKFFRMCQSALTDNGYIFFKENCIKKGQFVVDDDDSSVTRTDDQYLGLFKKAGLTLVKAEFQKSWPDGLFPVKMYALK